MPLKAPPLGSQNWQSCSPVEELSAYLERASTMPGVHEVAARTFGLMALEAGERALEADCGTRCSCHSLRSGSALRATSSGSITNVAFVEGARRRVRHLPTVRIDGGDAYALPYPDTSFDVAHCERVLMHLEEPTAALREVCRVVRARGQVVAAEPAWASPDIDHPDHETVALLIRRANTVRQHPRLGLELNRRTAEVGLVDRVVKAVRICSRDYAELVAYGLDLPAAFAALAADGRLPRSRAQRICLTWRARVKPAPTSGLVAASLRVGAYLKRRAK